MFPTSAVCDELQAPEDFPGISYFDMCDELTRWGAFSHIFPDSMSDELQKVV